MHFFDLQALWFLWLLPVVVIFYLLKRKRVVRLVSSTLLWQKFLAESQASAPFQKLRHNWLLILQLLLLLLAVFALMRPYRPSDARESQLRVLILDASASMRSTDVQPSRFEAARQQALQWVEGMRDGDQMMLLEAGGSTTVRQSATGEKGALKRALQAMQPMDSPTRLEEAFRLAETLLKARKGSEIHLFSDGAVPLLDRMRNPDLPIVFHQVGQRSENAGITRIDVKSNPENPSQRALFVNVGNFSTNQVETELELLFEGQLVEARPFALGPRESAGQVFLTEQARDGVFTVRLPRTDDLAADNEASIFSRVPRPLNVLLVTPGNVFLQEAIQAVPLVQLTTAAQPPADLDPFGVVVIDRVNLPQWPEKNLLVVQSVHPQWFESWSGGGEALGFDKPVETWSLMEQPHVVGWRSNHPVLRFLNFDNLVVARSLAVKPRDWGASLVDSTTAPLMVAGERGRQRIVWVGFDLLESTWVVSHFFPMFMVNALDWLNPDNALSAFSLIPAGEPFRMVVPAGTTEAEVVLPDQSRKTVLLNPQSTDLIFGDTHQRGVYRVRAGSQEVVFCVNLMNAEESDTSPRKELPFAAGESIEATTLRKANVEFWRWVALAALGLLLFEWWFYHRRTA